MALFLVGISVSFLLRFPCCAPESAVLSDREVPAPCTAAKRLDVSSTRHISLCTTG